MLAKFGLPFEKATPLAHFPKSLKRPRNNAGPAGQYQTRIQAGKQIPYKFLLHPLLSAEPDLNAAAAAPSQTEVTDLNCSDHSTTSKEMARGELW